LDWKHIIYRYQDLWQELAERRQANSESARLKPASPAIPLRQDPFRLFAEYPTDLIDEDTPVVTHTAPGADALATLRSSSVFASAIPLLLAENKCRDILRIAGKSGAVTVGELRHKLKIDDMQQFHRSVAWLAKTGLIQIIGKTRAGGR
jgi:nitroreductase